MICLPISSAFASVTEYVKNETRSKDLVPTVKTILGKGSKGEVFIHRQNENWVVKKSALSLVHEFDLGKFLNHPNIVKLHTLFIKYYPTFPIKRKYKLVMDRITGNHLRTCYGTHLPKETIISLITQAKDCCLYLFDHKVKWRDLHGENVFFDPKEEKLTFADFELWTFNEARTKIAFTNLSQARRLLQNILATSSLVDLPQVGPKADASVPQNVRDLLRTKIQSEADFNGAPIQKMRDALSDYFDDVISRFQVIA